MLFGVFNINTLSNKYFSPCKEYKSRVLPISKQDTFTLLFVI